MPAAGLWFHHQNAVVRENVTPLNICQTGLHRRQPAGQIRFVRRHNPQTNPIAVPPRGRPGFRAGRHSRFQFRHTHRTHPQNPECRRAARCGIRLCRQRRSNSRRRLRRRHGRFPHSFNQHVPGSAQSTHVADQNPAGSLRNLLSQRHGLLRKLQRPAGRCEHFGRPRGLRHRHDRLMLDLQNRFDDGHHPAGGLRVADLTDQRSDRDLRRGFRQRFLQTLRFGSIQPRTDRTSGFHRIDSQSR